MREVRWRGRAAASIENEVLRVTVLAEGGHVCEIFHKPTGVNPLWVPPWPTMDPSNYRGNGDSEARLLSGIHGHNLCLDLFGAPSAEEAAAGIGVHGEASVARYELTADLRMCAELPLHGLAFERLLTLHGERLLIHERVTNRTAVDRPIAYTQHVTLGPPFLEPGKTQFSVPATRAMTYPTDFAGPDGYLAIGREFDWPHAPLRDGSGTWDLRQIPDRSRAAAFSTQLMDPSRERAHFLAWSPTHSLAFGYEWRRADFPWLGIWEENRSRQHEPWNGRTLARGMEFGASPFPETRRAMIERGRLFDTPAFRWLPAQSAIEVEYSAFAFRAPEMPEYSP